VITRACSAAFAAIALAATAGAQDAAAPAPLLTLDDAIATAERQNHLLASTAREIDKADERAAALSTRRLPALHLDALGSRQNSLDFTVPAGALGTFPQVGAVPPVATKTSVPGDYSLVAMASASQPLTQQYRIGLGLEVLHLDGKIAREDVRRERQRVAAEVKTTYYQLAATEAGIEALRDLVRAVAELDAVTDRYLAEGVVLRPDALEVKARLARERQRLAKEESGLATQREHLNQLMGRDVTTPLRVSKPSELPAPGAGLSLEAARERAQASRAEIRMASLRTVQADTARKLAWSGWIPDVSLTASYSRLQNTRVLPNEVAIVGVLFSWEPFDWGRKGHEAAERAHEREQARQGREEAEEQIAVEVGQRWRALKDAAALLEASRLEADASTASLDMDRNRYKENATILRDVLRTEARLSGARHDFTDALAGYWSAAAALERAIGNENN
jgi:outer membrane protein TolC